MTTLADLIAEVAATHKPDVVAGRRYCGVAGERWPCDAVRLAAALSTENVAAGLDALDICGVDDDGNRHTPRQDAAALLAAMTVKG